MCVHATSANETEQDTEGYLTIQLLTQKTCVINWSQFFVVNKRGNQEDSYAVSVLKGDTIIGSAGQYHNNIIYRDILAMMDNNIEILSTY